MQLLQMARNGYMFMQRLQMAGKWQRVNVNSHKWRENGNRRSKNNEKEKQEWLARRCKHLFE